MQAELIILRGLPGSGKSTLAREAYPSHILIEADDFFYLPNGTYAFNPRYLRIAHATSLARVEFLLLNGYRTVVANTFTRLWEFLPYITFCSKHQIPFRVIHCTGEYRNNHNVPPEAIQRMKDRWNTYKGEETYP